MAILRITTRLSLTIGRLHTKCIRDTTNGKSPSSYRTMSIDGARGMEFMAEDEEYSKFQTPSEVFAPVPGAVPPQSLFTVDAMDEASFEEEDMYETSYVQGGFYRTEIGNGREYEELTEDEEVYDISQDEEDVYEESQSEDDMYRIFSHEEDLEISRENALAKIREVTLDLLGQLGAGSMPELTALDGSYRSNMFVQSTVRAHRRKAVDGVSFVREVPSRSSVRTRFLKQMLVLEHCLTCLTNDRTDTLRSVFYSLKEDFGKQGACNEVVANVARMMQTSRLSLGIVSQSRGYIAGNIHMEGCQAPYDENGRYIIRSIPPDIESIKISLHTKNPFVLVVEKETVFKRLFHSSLMHTYPDCTLVTGCGQPDTGTKNFVRRLCDLGLPVYGLFDVNPYSIRIYSTYCTQGGVRNIVHMGMKWDDVHRLETQAALSCDSGRQPLSDYDKRELASLLENEFIVSRQDLVAELAAMRNMDAKYELEYVFSSFGEWGIDNIISPYLQEMVERQAQHAMG